MNMNELFLQLYTEKYGYTVNLDIAKQLVEALPVTDGTLRINGERWSYADALVLSDDLQIDWETVSKTEFYLVLNWEYSQHCKTVKKYGLPDLFYAELAKNWFYAVDAEPDKTFKFFIHL